MKTSQGAGTGVHSRSTGAPCARTTLRTLNGIPQPTQAPEGAAAICERRFLLEGWGFGERLVRGFEAVRSDNETLFTARNEGTVKGLVNKYGIRYLVCVPGTDLALAKNLPDWLGYGRV